MVYQKNSGGGGGGTRDGVSGGGLWGEIPGTFYDIRCGRMGTCKEGGLPGETGYVLNFWKTYSKTTNNF